MCLTHTKTKLNCLIFFLFLDIFIDTCNQFYSFSLLLPPLILLPSPAETFLLPLLSSPSSYFHDFIGITHGIQFGLLA